MTATDWAKRYGVSQRAIARIGVERFAAATEDARLVWTKTRRGLTPAQMKIARERISAEDKASVRRERVMYAHLARPAGFVRGKKPPAKTDAINEVLYWLAR